MCKRYLCIPRIHMYTTHTHTQTNAHARALARADACKRIYLSAVYTHISGASRLWQQSKGKPRVQPPPLEAVRGRVRELPKVPSARLSRQCGWKSGKVFEKKLLRDCMRGQASVWNSLFVMHVLNASSYTHAHTHTHTCTRAIVDALAQVSRVLLAESPGFGCSAIQHSETAMRYMYLNHTSMQGVHAQCIFALFSEKRALIHSACTHCIEVWFLLLTYSAQAWSSTYIGTRSIE